MGKRGPTWCDPPRGVGQFEGGKQVNYVLKNDKDQLTTDDIAVQSPYNTYLVGGLPPGPIDSPARASSS